MKDIRPESRAEARADFRLALAAGALAWLVMGLAFVLYRLA